MLQNGKNKVDKYLQRMTGEKCPKQYFSGHTGQKSVKGVCTVSRRSLGGDVWGRTEGNGGVL